MEVQIESKPVPSSSPSQPSLFVKFLCCLDKATSPRQCTTLKERLPLIITHAHDLSFVESVIRALRLNAYAWQAFLRCLPASKARSRCSDAEAWVMIRLLSCEAEGKLQLTHRRSVLRCARQGSLTLRTLERVLARSALWHAQESADALVEFCRSLLFNFAFPSAHATSLILPYERPAMFPAKLATTFATWARALVPAVIVSPTSPDALRSRLVTLLLSAVLTTPERTRPLGPQQDQGFAVLSADILQRVASASPQLLLPHCDALRRLLFVHVHRLPPETIPSLCSVFHQLGAVSPRVRDSYVLSVQAMLFTFRRDHQGLGCIIANLLLGSGRLPTVEAKTLCDCATRALALSWPVMEHRTKSVLLRSLAHNLHHFDEESRAQIGRQFLIPHLQTLNILPAETRTPSAATDIAWNIGSGREKESAATATVLSLSEIAGEPRATSSSPPSVVFSIAAYLQADHAGLQDIVAHLLDAAEEAKDEGKEEEDQRRRQRWVALVDRLQHLTEVLPTYLALLQTASIEAEQQAADQMSIGFAMPVRFAELLKAATADDDDGGEASAAALFPPNEKGGRQARVGQIVRLALASLVGCLLCSSMLSLPRSATAVSRLAHTPGEWLMARIGFERALAKSAEELRAACQSEEEDEEEEEEVRNDEPPPQPRSLPLSLPRRSKRPASPSGLQVRASPSRSPSRSPSLSLSASTAPPRQIFVADDDDDDGIVLLKVEPDEEKDCADELPAILTCRPPALTRPRPQTKAESARPKKRVRIAVRPEDLETGDDELQNATDESPAGVRPRRTRRVSAADSIDVVVAPRRETVGPSLAHGCAIKQEADRVMPKSEEQPPTRDPQPAVAFIVTLRELYEDVIPHLDLSTCVELLKSVAHLPSCTDLTARLALFILHGLTRARAAPEGSCGGGVLTSVDAGQQLVPFLLGLTRTLSDEVHHLRLEVSHLYRRETINKRESDRAGQREIGTTLDAWKAKMDTLATLYQILEHLFRHPTTITSSSSSSSSSSLLASCCAYFDTPNARPVEVLESLYAHFTKLFTQCQNFFLAGLVIKVLLALTRGFRKRKYIAFPIYRALSSVYPSMHFLPSFPRSIALGRLPPLPEKWLSGAAVQESDGAVPFCVYVAFLLRSLSTLLPHSKFFLCARELTFALIDFLCTRELEYHHVFASMHQRSVPTILSGVLGPVSGHCASLLVTAERAQVLSLSGGICSLTLDYLSLVRRLVAAFALAQRAGYPIRVQTVLAACKRVFAALEHCMRSLLAAVASPAGDDDEEEEERLPPPADPPSQHQGEALSFLSQLASYGQGLLEEVLVIDLKSPKALKQSVGLRSVAEKMLEFLSDVKSACGPGIETATSAGREDLTRPHHDRHRSRARNADDDDDEEEEEELLSSEDDEDEAEDEGTTGFPFTLRRRGDPAEEWGLPGEANDPRHAPGSYFDGLDDRDGDHDDPDDDDASLDEDASFEVYGEDELCDSEDDEEDDQGSGGADSNDNDLYEYDPLLAVLDDHKSAAGASDDANGDDEFRVVFHK